MNNCFLIKATQEDELSSLVATYSHIPSNAHSLSSQQYCAVYCLTHNASHTVGFPSSFIAGMYEELLFVAHLTAVLEPSIYSR